MNLYWQSNVSDFNMLSRLVIAFLPRSKRLNFMIAEREEELKSPLMKVKEDREIFYLKLHIQKTKIMASGPITS